MQEYIKLDSETTEYKCPHCQKGYLLLNKNSFFEKQYLSSVKKSIFEINHDGDYDSDDGSYLGNIAGQLKCNHLNCNEVTSFIGETKYYLNYFDEGDREIEVSEKVIFFKYFIPSIHIIELKSEYPKELQEILLESFSLYFSSYSACVNTLRILLEKLCEIHGIKSIEYDNDKANTISLHTRLGKLEKKFNDDLKKELIDVIKKDSLDLNRIETEINKGKYKKLNEKLNKFHINDLIIELLEAIKWIGNEGSHCLEVVKKDDLDLTYRFVKKILDEIYPSPTDDEELNILAKEINENKGLRKIKK